ncbi:RHS repeat-associated core domain-containing protein [Vibrio tritonius]|uniref:RHS repeat-associated core domain-containing protein n=1 Tax=Vibrio tritonius TaxID=1435069 RepID=UPI0008391781|nr:RHS repeat-associated core domain-containing protein [Vibrio tritonius]
MDHSPYGAISGDDLSVQPFGMSTKRGDFESGLVYFGFRFYVPHLGRWLNRDPLQEQGGINLYGYVNGDPLGYVDPDGRYAIWVARGVAAAVSAGSDYLIQAGFYYAAHGSWIPWDCVDGYSMLESAGLGALGVTKSAGKLPLYDARTLKRMGEDTFHNFPASFEKIILSQKPIVRANGRSEYLKQGTINGKEGVFHITTDKGGKIMRHRAFIPKSDWARYSDRWELPSIENVAN